MYVSKLCFNDHRIDRYYTPTMKFIPPELNLCRGTKKIEINYNS